MGKHKLTLGLISLFIIAAHALAQDQPKYHFYVPDQVGAHAFHTPQHLIMESGFEALYHKKIHKFPFKRSARNLGYTLLHPVDSIKDNGGFFTFFKEQFIPLEPDEAWVPNYTWHLVGGGFRNRMMEEYYTHHNYNSPRLYAWLTSYAGHFMNELIQSEHADLGSIDALADLMFFDWVGKLLFENDTIAAFAREVFHIKDWTFQMAADPATGRLINNGQQYFLRVELTDFISIGQISGNMHNSLLLTISEDQQARQWSFGYGFKPETFSWKNNSLEPEFMAFGLFAAYSEHDNPIVTLVYRSEVENNEYYADPIERIVDRNNVDKSRKLLINVYPKWVNWGGLSPGFTFAYQHEAVYFGIVSALSPVGVYSGSRMPKKYRDDT